MEQIQTTYIVGISVRTTNENQQSAQDIPLLWQFFFENKINTQINNKINDNIYCLYTDYEKDFTKPYTCLIGYAVKDLNEIPEGLHGITIESDQYHKINITGNLQDNIVINEWLKIWNSDIKRKYKTDFECYIFGTNPQETQVSIYIS